MRILNAPGETAALIEDWFGELGCVVDHRGTAAAPERDDIARIAIETTRPRTVVVDLTLTTPLDLWRLQDVIEAMAAAA